MGDGDNKSNIHRALIFQGGGSLGAYEAGAYRAINEELSALLSNIGKGKEPIFHISNKTFDFSTTTINQLMQDGYQQSKEAMKKVLAENA